MRQAEGNARCEQQFAEAPLISLVELGLVVFLATSFKAVPSARKRQRLEIALFLPHRLLHLAVQVVVLVVPVVVTRAVATLEEAIPAAVEEVAQAEAVRLRIWSGCGVRSNGGRTP